MSALEADRKRREAMELISLYAQDIVKAWPTMTIRTIGQMTARVASLKQALDLLK